uniref:Agmatine deiminase n=1 Tax=Haptolina ericina TaxID=156174 RepID=A0A7S3C6H7_9EUKA
MKASYGIDTFLTIADPTGNYIEHMDCWGKFLSDDDVLVDRPPPSSRYAKQYDAAADFFAAKGWKVHRVDISGNDAYSNSLLLNGKAYVPITATSTPNAADQAALAVYQAALPTYDIVGVAADPRHRWENTDALHCRTRGLPMSPARAPRE